MNDVGVSLVADRIGSVLSRALARAGERITIVAPFITRPALERVIAGARTTTALHVYTRWRLDEIAAGASDLAVLDTVKNRRGSTIQLYSELHAKAVLIDDDTAFVGSCNITDRAMGFREPCNLEVMVELNPIPMALFLLVRRLERISIPATDELRRQIEEAILSIPSPPDIPEFTMPSAIAARVSSLFPSFRSPDRLFDGYLSVRDFRDPEARAALLDDLETLSPPHGLSEEEFNAFVSAALLKHPVVAAFDAFVSQPRYFGELVEWLARRPEFATLDTDRRKRHLQTLIRWLTNFRPQEYRLEEPRYSERFGRLSGWTGSE